MIPQKVSEIIKGSQFYKDSENKARAYLKGIIQHAEEYEAFTENQKAEIISALEKSDFSKEAIIIINSIK